MAIIYISFDQAIETHQKTVEVSGGGAGRLINPGQLESILEHIKNDDYYPTFEAKLTHLFFGVCEFHCFEDGNKRAAIALSELFLLLNGYTFAARDFIHRMENISYHVAAGRISKDLLRDYIYSLINDDEVDESLQLRIFDAIK